MIDLTIHAKAKWHMGRAERVEGHLIKKKEEVSMWIVKKNAGGGEWYREEGPVSRFW